MVNLNKGGSLNLTKQAGGTLSKVRVGLGWNPATEGAAFDADASIFGLGADGKAVSADWFVYFNNLKSPGDAIVHQGDNLTGEGDGDDEQIVIDLTAVPAEVQTLAIWVTIHEASQRGQAFAKVSDAYVRVLDESNGPAANEAAEVVLARYELAGEAPTANAVHFATLSRDGAGWSLTAVGEGSTGELAGVVTQYGL